MQVPVSIHYWGWRISGEHKNSRPIGSLVVERTFYLEAMQQDFAKAQANDSEVERKEKYGSITGSEEALKNLPAAEAETDRE